MKRRVIIVMVVLAVVGVFAWLSQRGVKTTNVKLFERIELDMTRGAVEQILGDAISEHEGATYYRTYDPPSIIKVRYVADRVVERHCYEKKVSILDITRHLLSKLL